MVDFKCRVCGLVYEEMVHGDRRNSMHCGVGADRVWVAAPGLAGISAHYSHSLGRRVASFTEEERELAKKNSWIATKSEANRLYDGRSFDDDVTIKRQNEADYQKAAAAALGRLKAADAVNADGTDKYGDDPVKMEQIAYDTAETIKVPVPTTE